MAFVNQRYEFQMLQKSSIRLNSFELSSKFEGKKAKSDPWYKVTIFNIIEYFFLNWRKLWKTIFPNERIDQAVSRQWDLY